MTYYYLFRAKYNVKRWDKDGAVVRALASFQCGPGSNPRVLVASMSSVASNLFCFKWVIQVILVAPK